MHEQPNPGGDEQLSVVPSRSEQIAWAAGLFEGEGTWNAYGHAGRNKKTVGARLTMTDRDVVEQFAAVLGFGTIRVRTVRDDRPTHSESYEWYTQRRANVHAMVEMFKPYLGKRRLARGLELLALGPAKPLNERTHCPNDHAYEGENLVLEPVMRAGRRYYARRCKTCRTEQARERARKKRGSKPENFRV